jgi:ubiquinone/menaquinone biosynthesis C-methylase UbiE
MARGKNKYKKILEKFKYRYLFPGCGGGIGIYRPDHDLLRFANADKKSLFVGFDYGSYLKDDFKELEKEAKHGNLLLRVEDATKMPLPDESFDHVELDYVLSSDNVKNEKTSKKILDECVRVLKKGGYLIICQEEGKDYPKPDGVTKDREWDEARTTFGQKLLRGQGIRSRSVRYKKE